MKEAIAPRPRAGTIRGRERIRTLGSVQEEKSKGGKPYEA